MGESISRDAQDRTRSQVLVIVAMALPVLLGGMTLATDVGDLYLNYFRLQTADDASVLSGAMYLPDQPARAISTARTYASLNGVASAEIVSATTAYDATLCPAPPLPPPPPVPGCKLTMILRRSVSYYFARLVGVDNGVVNTTSTATAGPAGAIDLGLVPIGVQYRSGDPTHSTIPSDGTAVFLRFTSPTAPMSMPNNWSALALGGKQFTTVFPPGYNGKVSVSDLIAPDRSATTTGPVTAAIQMRVSAGAAVDPSGSAVPPPNYTANDSRAVTVAMVDWGAAGGCCKVSAFAQLWIDSVSNANITGRWVANGVDGSLSSSSNFGALAISLTQ